MTRAAILTSVIALLAACTSPSGDSITGIDLEPPAVRPDLRDLERALASDSDLMEIVALGQLTREELIELGYPEENLTPVRVEYLIGEVARRHPELNRLSIERVPDFLRTPFSPRWGDGGLELALPPPDWVKRIAERLSNLCNWTRVAVGTASCVGQGLASGGASALACGGVFGGYAAAGCGTATYLVVEVPCVGSVVINECPGFD